jgi:hypothetical protein
MTSRDFYVTNSIRVTDYLVDLHGNVLVDFIGRYENIEADFREACRRIGIRPPALVHRRKAENRSNYRRYYTEATAGLIAAFFKRDIDMFDYSF